MVNGLAIDIRLALRALFGSRYVTVPAILTLALAIGANAGVFSIVNSLLLRPLPIADPHRLVSVTSDFAISYGFTAGAGWNTVMWEGLRAASSPFDGVLAWAPQRFTLGAGGDAERVDGFYGSGEFFATLGVRPRLGRLFSGDDDRAGEPVAVISHRLWVRRFGGAATAIGAPLIVDGVRTSVIGVTPEAFHGLEVGKPFDVALPIGADPVIRGRNAGLFSARNFGLLVMLRLKPDQSIASATSTLRGLQSAIVPGNAPAFVKEPFVLVAADGTASGPASPVRVYRQPILIMLGGVALVLVIACVNIANLLVARGIARQRELGVRLALGASRWRLVRPLFIESLLIAAAGGAIGLLLARWIARALTAISPAVLDLPLDWRVIGFTAAVTLIAALAFGLAPAQRAATRAAASLKTAGGTAAPRERLSTGLVVLQIALALVVAIPAGLFVRTFVRLATRPLGFDAARVLVVNAGTARLTGDPASHILLYQQLADAAQAKPGVGAAAVSLWTPLSGAGTVVDLKVPGARDTRVNVLANFVGPGWFPVYGTPIVAGRDFSTSDGSTSQKVVIVNEAFVRRFFADGQPAVGRMHDGNLVVGVAGDAVYRTPRPIPGVTSVALREPVAPTIYAPVAQLARWDRPPVTSIRISVRAAGGTPRALARAVGAALAGVEPNLLLEFRPLSDDVAASLVQERMSAAASSFFGAFSLLLAALGIYGVTAYTVSRRTSEIGVRMALGATPAGIRRLFLARALNAVGLGLLLGLVGAALAARSLTSLLFGVTPLDPAILFLVSLLVVGVTIAAALIPAQRASRTDPWLSLRAE